MSDLLELARAVAGRAENGEEVEAYVSRGRETSLRVFEQEIESLTSAGSAGVGVRVVSQGRTGFAWVAALDDGTAAEALDEARDNARFATFDEHAGLAKPDGVVPAEIDLWREDVALTPTDAKVDLALELERMARGMDPRIRQVVHANYADGAVESAIATTAGIERETRRTSCFVSVSAIAADGDESQTGYGYSAGRSFGDLDAARAAGDAVGRATRLLGATKPASSHLTVVFDRRITAMLLAILAQPLSGEEVSKGRSLFANRVGEEVAVANFSLLDDATNPLAWGAAPSDAEGLACRRNGLIEGGKLLGYLYDTHAGRVAGTCSTASAVRGGYRTTPGVGARALTLEPGDLTYEEVIARVDRGLFVQSVSGVHSGVNVVSGDFSVGAEGLMIRQGALAEPVREVTVASTMQRMLQHVSIIGGDLEWLPGASSGVTLAIDDMSMSGI